MGRGCSRRRVVQGALGAAVAGAMRGSNCVSARQGGDPLAAWPPVAPSPAAAAWMSRSEDDRRAEVAAAIDQLTTMKPEPLLALGEPLHALLPGVAWRPPTLSPDVDALTRGDDQGSVYCLASLDYAQPFRSLGLVEAVRHQFGGNASTPYFSSNVDAIFLGATAHALETSTGTLTIQIAYFGGYHEERRRGRWTLPLFLGWTSDDPTVSSPLYGAPLSPDTREPLPALENRSGDQPPGTYGTARYQWALNTLFDLRGAGVFTLSVGLPGVIEEAEAYLQQAVSVGLPTAFWTPEYRVEEDRAARRYYDWLTWRAVSVAAASTDPQFAAWTGGPVEGGQAVPIADVFPEALADDPPVSIPSAKSFLRDAKRTLSLEDLVALPRFQIVRASPAPEFRILPVVPPSAS